MAPFTMQKRISAPVDVVFEVASDLEHAAENIRAIEKVEVLTPGPVGVATRWRETRKMMGREATETIEFTAFDRPRSFTAGCESCGAYLETVFRFETANGMTPGAESATPGTDVTVETRWEARSLFAKLMSPLMSLMFRKTLRGCIEADLEDLKRAAESRTTASA
jgi:hypothetical protein